MKSKDKKADSRNRITIVVDDDIAQSIDNLLAVVPKVRKLKISKASLVLSALTIGIQHFLEEYKDDLQKIGEIPASDDRFRER